MWIILATLASMFWGMSYVFSEQIFKHISVLTSLAIEMFVVSLAIFGMAIYEGVFKKDIVAIGSSGKLFWLVAASTATWLIAELGIGYAINGSRDATLAGLIEISYPLFIALFAYLFFKEQELHIGTALGGLLIFLGVASIYWFSK